MRHELQLSHKASTLPEHAGQAAPPPLVCTSPLYYSHQQQRGRVAVEMSWGRNAPRRPCATSELSRGGTGLALVLVPPRGPDTVPRTQPPGCWTLWKSSSTEKVMVWKSSQSYQWWQVMPESVISFCWLNVSCELVSSCSKALFTLLFIVSCVFSVMPNFRLYCSAKQILHGLPYIIPHSHFIYFDHILWAEISSVVLFIINILLILRKLFCSLYFLVSIHKYICYQKWYRALYPLLQAGRGPGVTLKVHTQGPHPEGAWPLAPHLKAEWRLISSHLKAKQFNQDLDHDKSLPNLHCSGAGRLRLLL